MTRNLDLPPGSTHTLARWVDLAPDPLEAYRRLTDSAERRDTLLLESGAADKRPTQSLIVVDAAVRATSRRREVVVEALGTNGAAVIAMLARRFEPQGRVTSQQADRVVLQFPPGPERADDSTRIRAASPLDVLRALGPQQRLVQSPARGCVICAGVFAYDLLDNYEPLPEAATDPLEYPDYSFWLAETIVRIDHRARRTQIACNVFGSSDREAVSRAYHDASRRMGDIIHTCEAVARTGRVVPPAVSRRPVPPEFAPPDLDDARYAALVESLKERVRAGDVFQIVPSRTFAAPCPRPLATYAALRQLNPSPYMFYVAAPDHTLLGASPEAAVKVKSDDQGRRIAQIRPIAGTRPRGHNEHGEIDHDLDNRLEVELRSHEKEVAEHMMLIDLARNDIARVSKPGTRYVDEILTTERYSHVMHLVSNVRGELADDLDALHAYQASMNMGTLVGAPKVRAAQLLRQHEPKRGPYGGAVGYLTEDGELDTAIIIRSAVVKHGQAYVRAGAGVVYDSDPQLEADETRRKAASVLTALAASHEREDDHG
ncbi:MAG: anthranilate synthase component 1 [Myxococcales bacterium FL481]|nr:MAG: anthranilate synthase component 1 [Myxococcales bacterium FL481]